MGTLWLLLILLACPLMMVFMMRGMGGGATTDKDPVNESQPVGDQDIRIAQLEREVAELRGVSLRKADNNPARRR